jgi:hypothetical protein
LREAAVGHIGGKGRRCKGHTNQKILPTGGFL